MTEENMANLPTFITKSSLNRENHTSKRYGNYSSYYSHFRSTQVPDPRLSKILPYLKRKSVLDLGCNSGKLTRELTEHCHALRSVGVDIDSNLILQARQSDPSTEFECFDFVSTWPFPGSASGEWDVILLLSVVKWVHLNNSDEALCQLFRRLHDIATPAGLLVVEPQDWPNYKKAVKKCPLLRENFKTLQMRPPFVPELEEAGWRRLDSWKRDEFGFEREVHIWQKVDQAHSDPE